MTKNELIERADIFLARSNPEYNASFKWAYEMVQELRDHLASMGDGWRDISTAPKDGTQILCCERWWLSKAGHKMGGHIYIARWNEDKWLNSSGFRQPTDWMQLPYLPQPPENS